MKNLYKLNTSSSVQKLHFLYKKHHAQRWHMYKFKTCFSFLIISYMNMVLIVLCCTVIVQLKWKVAAVLDSPVSRVSLAVVPQSRPYW